MRQKDVRKIHPGMTCFKEGVSKTLHYDTLSFFYYYYKEVKFVCQRSESMERFIRLRKFFRIPLELLFTTFPWSFPTIRQEKLRPEISYHHSLTDLLSYTYPPQVRSIPAECIPGLRETGWRSAPRAHADLEPEPDPATLRNVLHAVSVPSYYTYSSNTSL